MSVVSLVSLPLRLIKPDTDETPPRSRNSPGLCSSCEDSWPGLHANRHITAFTVSSCGRPQPRRGTAPGSPEPAPLSSRLGNLGIVRGAQSRTMLERDTGLFPEPPSSGRESLASVPLVLLLLC